MTDAERADDEATEADFMRRHPDCHAGRLSMSGSRTIHCMFCCPPPPLSDKQISQIRAILTGTGSPDPADLDTWRLTLTCDHTIEKTQHSSNRHWSASTVTCTTCDRTRGIINSEKLRPNPARHAAEHHRLTVELDRARVEYERHQKRADSARRRVDNLEPQLSSLGAVTHEGTT